MENLYSNKNLAEQERIGSIHAFRNRLLRLYCLRYSLIIASIWLFIWGLVIMVARVTNLIGWENLFFGIFGLVAVFPIACMIASRKLPDEKRLSAALDGCNRAGGLVMAALETDTSDWAGKVPHLEVPKARWKNDKTVMITLGALLFVIVAFVMPDSTIIAGTKKPFRIEDQVRGINEQLEMLEEENILTPEEVQKFKADIEKIEANAEGEGPNKTWDALDELSKQLSQLADEAAQETMRDAETLAKAEALAREAAEQIAEQLDPETAREMAQGVGDKLSEMLNDNPQLAEELANNPELSDEIKEMLKNGDLGNMTPEQLKELAEAMKNCQNGCERMLENLAEGNMIDQEMLDALREMSESIGREELDRMLSELNEGCEACGECEGCKNGGRCTKKQNWRRDPTTEKSEHYADMETDEDGAKFKSESLPSPSPESIKNMQKIGASIGAPEVKEGAGEGTQGGAITETRGGTGSAHSQTILPQHRGTIGRYFERK